MVKVTVLSFSYNSCILHVMVCLESISYLPSFVVILIMLLRPMSSERLVGLQFVAIHFAIIQYKWPGHK